MSVLGEMLIQEGIEKGIKEGMEKGIERGEFAALYDLIQDGLLSMETAAKRKGMGVQEFQRKLKEFNML